MTSETHETRHHQPQASNRGRALPLSRERCWVPTQMGELHPDFYRLGDHLAGEPQCRWLVNAQNKDYCGLSKKLIEKAIYLVPGTEIKRGGGGELVWQGSVTSLVAQKDPRVEGRARASRGPWKTLHQGCSC